ncbi:hypothetical protein P2A73_08945 [Xanthomonas perforans]
MRLPASLRPAIAAMRRCCCPTWPMLWWYTTKVASTEAQVSGAFPQSPLQLEHVFRLVDGKIAALRIH